MKQRLFIRITALLCAVNLLLLCPMTSAESLFTEDVDLTVSVNESIAALPQNIQSLLSNVKTGDVLVPNNNLYELTVQHADGSYTTEVYSVPVKYTDDEGEVQYIDTSMQSATLLDTLSFNPTYRNQGGYVDLAYKADITDGVAVDEAFTLSVPEQADQQSARQITEDDGSGKIIYPQAFGEHTYVEYINTYAGFKENIVLEQNIGQNTFDFVWESDTHIPVLIDDNKAIQIVSKTNPKQVDYTISPLYVYDSFDPTTSDDPYAHKHWTEDCRYDIIDQGEGVYTIRAIVSEEYLNHPETVYPVTIDPSVVANTETALVYDSYVMEANAAQNYGNYTYLRFGYENSKRIYAYVKFNALPSLPAGAYFTSAKFKVTFRTGQNTPADMEGTVKRCLSEFNEDDITWNNRPSVGSAYSSILPQVTDGYLDYYNFTVTNIVRDSYGRGDPCAFMFTYKTETYADYNSVVSSEGDAARAPKLTINYTVPSSQTSGITNDGYYFIRNRSTGKYLTLSDDSMNVELTDYTGTSNQLWQTQYNGNGSYMLVPRADTARCIDSGALYDGGGVAAALISSTESDPDQLNDCLFIVVSVNGYYRIASRSTSSVWALRANGTSVENYTYTGATNQQWVFEEYSLSLTTQSDWVIAGDTMTIIPSTLALGLTWTTSDSGLAMISGGSNYALFWGRSAGTVTVTATAENGDTASCTVEIIANTLQTMTQGLSIEGTIAQGGEYWYKFTPTTSDTYTFTTTGSTDTRGELYQYLTPLASDDDSGAGFNFSISYYLEAGKTYRLKVRGYSNNTSGAYSIKVESVFLDNLQALQNLAKAYSNDDETSVELTMQFVRREKYNDGFWPDTAGNIDEDFVDYVEDNNLALHDYFTIDEDYYWQAPNGDIIDIPHLAATFNAYFHDSYGIIGDVLYVDETYVDNLAGWGADLRSLVPEVMRDVNYTTVYDDIYTKTYQYIGKSGTKFDMNDLLADTDAYNMYNLLDASSLKSTFTTYYSTGVATRYTDFTNGWTRNEIYDCAEFILNSFVIGFVDPLEKVNAQGISTGEELDMTDSQMNAVCNAFTDYIWNKVQAE